MSEKNVQPEYLSKLLHKQKTRLQQMMLTLEKELEAIKNRDSNLMVEISEQKELQLQSIRSADALFNNDESVRIINSVPELKTLQKDISDLLVQCQTQNEVCYLTATQNQIALEQVKNLLIGGAKNTTYNEQGQKSSSGSLSKGIKA